MTTRAHSAPRPTRHPVHAGAQRSRHDALRIALRALVALGFAAGWLGPSSSQAANVSVSPGSGAGGRLVQLTSSGFDLDGIGFNTGFYVDGASIGRCPDTSRANCSITVQVPAYTPGGHSVTATNSIGEQASTTFNVAQPHLSVSPACAPAGTEITVDGRFFAVGADAGIYLDGMLVANFNFPNSEGTFSRTVAIPNGTTDGEHTLSVSNSVGTSQSRVVTIGASCAVVGEVTDLSGGGMEKQLPDGSWAPLALGEPIRQNDEVRTAGNGRGRIHFIDNTSLTLYRSGRLSVEDYIVDPPSQEGRSFSDFLGGAFGYVSGYMKKKNNPENVAIDTPFGSIGIRGTELFVLVDPLAGTTEIDLMHGFISVTPSISGLTSEHEGPVAITIEDGEFVTVPEPKAALALAVACAALLVAARRSAGSRAPRIRGDHA